MKSEFSLETRHVLAERQCKRVIGTQSNGRPLHCLDAWRIVQTDGKYRYGTMKCLHGHVQRGQMTTLVNPMERGR